MCTKQTTMSKIKIKNQLVNYMIENYNNSNDIKSFCDNVLFEIQKECAKNPKVYLSVNRDLNNEKRYITAITKFPIKINKVKEYRVYVGTLDNFPNGTKDVNAKNLAKRKIIERLDEVINETIQ